MALRVRGFPPSEGGRRIGGGGTRMPARTPEELPRLFAEAFSAHDLEAALALYEPGATLIALPGEVVTGTEAIREALGASLALEPKFDLAFNKALEAGDIALLFSDWTLSTTDPDGNAVELAGRTSDVARRQPDGNWLFVIDDPYGGEHGFG
jgi:uncharacterized protein (TIGR02246 family)